MTMASSVWDSIIGQKPTVDLLSRIASTSHQSISHQAEGGGKKDLSQSWLICGAPGSGRSQVAQAFAAALECPQGGCGQCPTCLQIMKGEHPDVTILATDKVTISIDQVRSLVAKSEQMPATAPWRILIIEDVDRMLERTTNVLLKEVEEPADRTIWLLCAPSSQDVLPTIRSRTRVVNLAIPPAAAISGFLQKTDGVEKPLADRCARLAQGHIGIARLYSRDDQALADRDEIVVSLLDLRKASDAVILAASMVDRAQSQAAASVQADVDRRTQEFLAVNGLGPQDKVPTALRGDFNAIGKKEDVRRRTTRLTRDVLDRFLTTISSVWRDMIIVQNGAEASSGLVNKENATAIINMAAGLSRQRVIANIRSVDLARRRLARNGSPLLVVEALLCSFLSA